MDAQTCLKKLGYVGVLSFATVDGGENPQVRNISAIHYEPDSIFFYSQRRGLLQGTSGNRKSAGAWLYHV